MTAPAPLDDPVPHLPVHLDPPSIWFCPISYDLQEERRDGGRVEGRRGVVWERWGWDDDVRAPLTRRHR